MASSKSNPPGVELEDVGPANAHLNQERITHDQWNRTPEYYSIA